MNKNVLNRKSIQLGLVIAAAAIFILSGCLCAYAEENGNPGEVTQVFPDQSGQTGPAFDTSLNNNTAKSNSEVGPGVNGTGSDSNISNAAGNSIDPSRPMIALTFDDGPHGSNTPRLLSILEMYGAKATFFVVGSRISGREAILQRAIADGCEIGNHSYGHETLTRTSHAKTVQTLNSTSDLIQSACGVRPTLMRPPGGAVDTRTMQTIGSLGMSAIMWNIDTLDWKTRNPQATISCVLNNVKDGDIILMHDIHSTTVDACGALIPELINRGYQLVTVSQLAAARGGMVPGGKYFSFRP